MKHVTFDFVKISFPKLISPVEKICNGRIPPQTNLEWAVPVANRRAMIECIILGQDPNLLIAGQSGKRHTNGKTFLMINPLVMEITDMTFGLSVIIHEMIHLALLPVLEANPLAESHGKEFQEAAAKCCLAPPWWATVPGEGFAEKWGFVLNECKP